MTGPSNRRQIVGDSDVRARLNFEGHEWSVSGVVENDYACHTRGRPWICLLYLFFSLRICIFERMPNCRHYDGYWLILPVLRTMRSKHWTNQPIALIRKLHTLKSSLKISDSVCYEAAPTIGNCIYIYTHNI